MIQLIIGNKLKKISKKPKYKKRVPNLKKATDNAFMILELRRVRAELSKLCKKADMTSLFHLAVAIIKKYRYYMTGDEHLLKRAATIYDTYHIKLCRSLYEVNEYPAPTEKTPFDFYT